MRLTLPSLAATLLLIAAGCAASPQQAATQPTPEQLAPPPAASQQDLLPAGAEALLAELHAALASVDDGAVADYIPQLALADAEHFGIAIVTVDGRVFTVGDTDVPFTIQSIAKPFVFGLALRDHPREELVQKVGVEPTGLPFNSVLGTEVRTLKTQNPLVNPGAIATTSLIQGADSAEQYARVAQIMDAYAGESLGFDEAVYQSEMASNSRNMALAWQLVNQGILYGDPEDAVRRYTRAGCITVTARTLAQMGATLANGGSNPLTGARVLEPLQVVDMLSVMSMAGLYDYSGEWMFRVGLPAKSGVGGGIVAVVPGRFAIATFSPPLDRNGNSVRGIRAITELSRRWGLHLLLPR
ncbi:MAG: glutaminase A [Planctomycetota bacterium]|nr:MAG: glutaminase A [Planctomycetota bacterium]